MALKILLADDSMTAQNLAKKILMDAGHEVIAVSNGAAAMKKISAEKPDLLILDVYMPGYTGLEVCEKVKTTPETASTPVLLTLAPMEPYNATEGKRVHADGVILKPFEARDLVPAVAKLEEKAIAARKPETKASERNLAWKSNRKPDIEPIHNDIEKESEVAATTLHPEPFDVSDERASAPAFLEQFGEEFTNSPATSKAEFQVTSAATSERAGQIASATVQTLEAEAAPAALNEFELPAHEMRQDAEAEREIPAFAMEEMPELSPLVERESETSVFTMGQIPGFPDIVEQELPAAPIAFEESLSSGYAREHGAPALQSELEIDAANATLGELGFAAGLSDQSEVTGSNEQDWRSESANDIALGRTESSASEAGATDSGQDPELMVDRTEIVQFATRFGSDGEDVPAGIAFEELQTVSEVELGIERQEDASGQEWAAAEISAHNSLGEQSQAEDWPGAEQHEGVQEFEQAASEVQMPDAYESEAYETEHQTTAPVESLRSEATLDEEAQEALAELPEVGSGNREMLYGSLAQRGASTERDHLEAPREAPRSASSNLIDKAIRAVERALYGDPQVDTAFSPMDASQFFRPEEASEAEFPLATEDQNEGAGREVDEYAVEEAVTRVLERLRPQLVSEVVRELSHSRD